MRRLHRLPRVLRYKIARHSRPWPPLVMIRQFKHHRVDPPPAEGAGPHREPVAISPPVVPPVQQHHRRPLPPILAAAHYLPLTTLFSAQAVATGEGNWNLAPGVRHLRRRRRLPEEIRRLEQAPGLLIMRISPRRPGHADRGRASPGGQLPRKTTCSYRRARPFPCCFLPNSAL